MRVKRHDIELWMSHRMLPEFLKERIRRNEQYKWQENRGVDEETLIRNLPRNLRRDLKRHFCLDLVKRTVLYAENSFIVREGDPVEEMLFIMSRKVSSVTTNGGRTGFFNSLFLMAGDFCGEEILIWASDPSSSSKLPISTRTGQTISEVEAFALMSEDLKLLASEFRNHGGKQLHHALRQGSIPGSRGHGLPVSYKQLGADTGKRRLRGHCMKPKTS
ncbi:hypothetical protein JHK86_008553 [Glycine max]|nr:hypothetical protein JHK86_008553 [Glycine max]